MVEVTMKNIEFLMNMTKEFLEGKMGVISYCLDFPYEFECRYKKMLRESRDYVEIIYDELIEKGIHVQYDENLSDKDFRNKIRKHYKYIKEVEKEGFF